MKCTTDKYLTDSQYLTALLKLRDIILTNDQMVLFGFHPAEFTCNWGICAKNSELWNTEDVMLFPEHFNSEDPITHVKLPLPHHKCPLDERKEKHHFSDCRKFCAAAEKEQEKEKVLELINHLIQNTIHRQDETKKIEASHKKP